MLRKDAIPNIVRVFSDRTAGVGGRPLLKEKTSPQRQVSGSLARRPRGTIGKNAALTRGPGPSKHPPALAARRGCCLSG